jgi:hypothetical protein
MESYCYITNIANLGTDDKNDRLITAKLYRGLGGTLNSGVSPTFFYLRQVVTSMGYLYSLTTRNARNLRRRFLLACILTNAINKNAG